MAAISDGPIHTCHDRAADARSGVSENFAGKNLSFVSYAIAAYASCGLLWAAGRTDAVRTVAVPVLSLLAGDERLADDGSADEIGMAEVKSGIEYGDANTCAASAGVLDICCL